VLAEEVLFFCTWLLPDIELPEEDGKDEFPLPPETLDGTDLADKVLRDWEVGVVGFDFCIFCSSLRELAPKETKLY